MTTLEEIDENYEKDRDAAGNGSLHRSMCKLLREGKSLDALFKKYPGKIDVNMRGPNAATPLSMAAENIFLNYGTLGCQNFLLLLNLGANPDDPATLYGKKISEILKDKIVQLDKSIGTYPGDTTQTRRRQAAHYLLRILGDKYEPNKSEPKSEPAAPPALPPSIDNVTKLPFSLAQRHTTVPVEQTGPVIDLAKIIEGRRALNGHKP